MTEAFKNHFDEVDNMFKNVFEEFFDEGLDQIFEHPFFDLPENLSMDENFKMGSQSGQNAVAQTCHQSSLEETNPKKKIPPNVKLNDEKRKMEKKICRTWGEGDTVNSSEVAKRKRASRKEKKTRLLPKKATDEMKKWLWKNCERPYPTLEKKWYFCIKYNLTLKSVERFFINGRRRYL